MVPPGLAKWYAPNAMCLASAPARFSKNRGSVNLVPSVALAYANLMPAPLTLNQSMRPLWWETSIPGRVLPEVALARAPPVETSPAASASAASADTLRQGRRVWRRAVATVARAGCSIGIGSAVPKAGL